MFFMTGDTTFLISDTSPPEDTITVPGAMIFFPSWYFCVMESESFPVGTFICSSQQKSDRALTALYSRASSPSCARQGHIQLAESDMLSMPSAMGAHTRFVSDSATDSTEPASGSASAACGACPRAVAMPVVPV